MHVSVVELFAAAAAILNAPQVNLPTGVTVTGKFQTNGAGSQVQVFEGIPYAEPPVGELRWKQTTLKPLTSDLNATTLGSICHGDPKLDLVTRQLPGSEDCLFLNVYAPVDATKDSNLPVMVWIHGGGFIAGAANAYDSSDLVGAGDQNLVVVTINYRLSVFGFLSNEEILGEGNGANFGLRDQEIAFQWVKEYISYFGGNPRDVTVFGESAGAWSIATHLVSRNGEQELFQKAILQSGAFLPAMTMPTPTVQAETTEKLAASVGCSGSASTLVCLRLAGASDLINASIVMTADKPFASMPLLFGPSVDGVMLLDTSLRRFLSGKFSKIPTIAGTNTDEGWLFAPADTSESQFEPYLRSNYLLTEDELKHVAELYPPANFRTPRDRLGEIYGDVAFVCMSEQLSMGLSLSQPTYRYRFNLTDSNFGIPLVIHTKELDFVFNRTGNLPKDQATNTTVGYFTAFWTHFARSGNPNVATSSSSYKQQAATGVWPEFKVLTKQQLVLQPTLAVERNGAYMPMHEERCAFWKAVDLRVAASVSK